MIEVDKLKTYANKLMFDMSNEEYLVLQKEFDTILKHMDIIDNLEGIDFVEPMTFPFDIDIDLIDDDTIESLSVEEAFRNAKSTRNNRLQVPKVVS
ncbi:MAG TPA: hypothetical protein PLT65_02945 [Bacilli bacterium]|nr:hypothetical protein [Bacilli bacterium]